MTAAQNKQNVRTGQQGTTEPWKDSDKKDNGRPKSPPNVVDQELKKKKTGVASPK